jgi:hypothetical protein
MCFGTDLPILAKSAARIFYSETGDSLFPQNACQSIVENMMSYVQR